MAEETRMTREERLAAKLRENLRRRKAQARAMATDTGPQHDTDDTDDALSKKPSDS